MVLLLAAAAIAGRLGRRISEPLLEVAGTAHQLREGDLAARADVRGTEETHELARALNGLAERTSELLAHERAAVGDLSHRLRTPVTALRLDAEAVPDTEVAARLQEHVTVLQRTIDAVVKDARRPVRTDLAPRCDATDGARRLDSGRRWPTTRGGARVRLPDEPCRCRSPGDLVDLVDVLLDNVFAHTPEGTALAVSLVGEGSTPSRSPTRARVPPSVPAAVGSTGLGLDIAGRTAAAVGGTLATGALAPGARGSRCGSRSPAEPGSVIARPGARLRPVRLGLGAVSPGAGPGARAVVVVAVVGSSTTSGGHGVVVRGPAGSSCTVPTRRRPPRRGRGGRGRRHRDGAHDVGDAHALLEPAGCSQGLNALLCPGCGALRPPARRRAAHRSGSPPMVARS